MQRSVSIFLALVSVIVTMLSYANPWLLHYAANGTFWQNVTLVQRLLEVLMYQFLHGWVLHLFANVFFLVYFGPGLERLLGKARYIVFFLTNTVFVYAALVLFSGMPTIGISGFCMAILAYTALELHKRRHPEAKAAFLMLFINVAIGFSGPISLVWHAAGAVFGGLWYLFSGLSKR